MALLPWRWIGAGAVVLALAGGIYWLGGRDARHEADELRAQIETDRRMDDAAEDMRGRDDDGILDWLFKRGQR